MKSSIADHVANENHLINWEESNILAKDNERNTRWILESLSGFEEKEEPLQL